MEELKQAMNDFNATLSNEDVCKMVGSILRRAQLCLDCDGGNFEHLLKKKKTVQETGDSCNNDDSSSEDSEEDDYESEDLEEESEITSSIEIAEFSDAEQPEQSELKFSFLVSENPLPNNASRRERLLYSIRSPPHGKFGRFLALFFLVLECLET